LGSSNPIDREKMITDGHNTVYLDLSMGREGREGRKGKKKGKEKKKERKKRHVTL